MNDANVSSLLDLPILGFVDRTNEEYKNPIKMLLEKKGNPYYLNEVTFHGIGGMFLFSHPLCISQSCFSSL